MRLELGTRRPPALRVERIGREPGWHLLFLSDLHLTPRKVALVDGILDVLAETRADAVLLGGDLVDRRGGLDLLRVLVRGLASAGPVVAIPGNHDRWVGVDAVGRALELGGGAWLPHQGLLLRDPVRAPLTLMRRLPSGSAAPEASMTDPHGTCGLEVLVAHAPYGFPEAARRGIDLVLAGHLHGGQCVLWRQGGREWPGALWSRWNGPRFERGSSTLIVGRGLSDTLPLRWNCPREILSCRVGLPNREAGVDPRVSTKRPTSG